MKEYSQANRLYRHVVANWPDSEDALWSQADLIKSYFAAGDDPNAEIAVEKLLGDFSEREYLPLAVHEIAEKCGKSRGDEGVWEVCRDMLEGTASGENGIWSQMGLAILDIYLGGQLAAQATIDDLMADTQGTGFSGDARSSEALGQIGWAYRKLENHTKAAELYQYVVDNWSEKPRAVFSYRGLVYCKLALGDEAGAWAVVEDLLGRFAADENAGEAVYSLGQKYDRLGQRDKARLLYEYVLTNKPKSMYAMWAQRGIVFMDIKLGNFEAAEAGIEVILADYPDHNDLPQALQWLGNDYYRARDYEKAQNSYRYVTDNWPESEYALGSQKGLILSSVRLKDGPGTNGAIDGLFAKFSENQEVAQMALALGDQCRHGLDDYAAARRLYGGLLAGYPDSEEAMWAQRGIVNMDIKSGNYAAAEGGIATMVGKYPDHNDVPQALQWLGNDYYKVKEYAKAANSYGYVVDNWPASEYALGAQKGLILSRVNLKDDPNTNAAIDDLFVKFAGRGDVARAAAEVADECRRDLAAYAPADAGVQTLLTKYARHADLPKAFYYLGNDYLDARKNAEAAQCYQYTIENRPDSNEAMLSWSGIGRVHIRNGDDQAAQTVVDKIIADFNDAPDLADAVFKIGDEYYKAAFVDPNKCKTIKSAEDLNRAKGVFEKIIAQCPQSKSIGLQHANYFLAVSYRKLGQPDKAVGYYQNVVDNWPKYQYAWSAQCLIGECYEGLKQLGKMPESAADPNIVKAYKAVIEEYPDCSLVGHACLKLGNIYFKASQWDEAATYFGLFLEKSPEDVRQATALYHLGETYEEMGESDTATEVYRMFLEEANPADRRVAVVRAKLDELGGQK